jgi:hypothetical protein
MKEETKMRIMQDICMVGGMGMLVATIGWIPTIGVGLLASGIAMLYTQ